MKSSEVPMSLFNDIKYANMLAPYITNFKRKKENVWNFSCPICGDSKKNTSKKRGYIYRPTNKNYLAVKCYNCPYSSTLGKFVAEIAPQLYKEYLMEAYQEMGNKPERQPYKQEELPELFQEMELSDAVLDALHRLDKLPETHPAVAYVLSRKIPREIHNLLYFTGKFKQYVNTILPNKFPSLDGDIPRLIIPYFNKHGKCFAFQGRAFGNEQPKYITIKIDSNAERLFGLERINWAKTVYVCEGPLDSLFIPNCIAVSGSSYDSPTIDSIRTNCVIIPDNERRNSNVTKLIGRMINKGYKVCLWPDSYEFKDINDAVKDGGLTKEEILNIINANIYQGMAAKLRFAGWKR